MHYESGYETIASKWVNRVYERGTIFLLNDGSSDTGLKKMNTVAVNMCLWLVVAAI